MTVLAVTASAVIAAACTEKAGRSPQFSSAFCVVNSMESCTCADGRRGARLCGPEGAFGPCICEAQNDVENGGPEPSPYPSQTEGAQAAGSGENRTEGVAGTDGNPAGDGGVPLAQPVLPTTPGEVIVDPADEAATIFDDALLRTYELVISQADLDSINSSPAAEQYVQGSLLFEGQTYGPVGVRYKGNYGGYINCAAPRPFQSPFETPLGPKTCPKLSIKVSFNWRDPEGRFFGMKKLQFHSMNVDESMMRDRLGYALFNDMEVPAPRAVHARLLINGKLEGLFALVEQIDGRFTRSRFTEGGEGNLYKEVWPIHADPAVYINALESNTEESPSAARMMAFKAAIDSGQGVDAIDGWLDLDHIARYIAVDRTLVNDDGIFHWWCSERGTGRNPGAFGNHNYYWYEEVDADRMWLIPWDLDLILGNQLVYEALNVTVPLEILYDWDDTGQTCACVGNPLAPQRPPGCDQLTRHWATLRDRYRAEVRRFLEGPFSDDQVTVRLDRWAAQIDGAVREQEGTIHNGHHITHAAWTGALGALRNTIFDLRNQAWQRVP